MKRLLYSLLFAGCFLLYSCAKEPSAFFGYNTNAVVKTNAPVQMVNYSVDADSYEWDFGDGTTSTEVAPVHVYTNEGSYTITLKARSKNGKKEDVQTKPVTVITNTNPLFVGIYNVSESCNISGNSNYTLHISDLGNDLALVNLKNSGQQVVAIVFSFNMQIQQQNIVIQNNTFGITGSGALSGNTINCFYNISNGVTAESCNFTAIKQ